MLGPKETLIAAAASAVTLAAVTMTAPLQKEDKLGMQDTPMIPGTKWHVHDGLRPQPTVITPCDTATENASAPSDATVLFDGTSLDAWTGGKWALEDGVMTVNGTGDIQSKAEFGDCQLHLEWRAPKQKEGQNQRSQGRGNSGVFFFGRYEVQVLDCFQNETYPDGMTGALYGQEPPMVNACRPAGEWQTYDILFRAPRFGDDGRLQVPAAVTVLHNGVALHHGRAMLGATRWRAVASYETHKPTGPIKLQDHGNPISFRNIWVRPLERAK